MGSVSAGWLVWRPFLCGDGVLTGIVVPCEESAHAVILGLGDLCECSFGDHGAVIKHHQAVGDFAGAGEVVGDDDAADAEFVAKLEDEFVDAVGSDGIESGGGLIVEHQAWFSDNGAGETDALFLAA